jgi:hypothetical protein
MPTRSLTPSNAPFKRSPLELGGLGRVCCRAKSRNDEGSSHWKRPSPAKAGKKAHCHNIPDAVAPTGSALPTVADPAFAPGAPRLAFSFLRPRTTFLATATRTPLPPIIAGHLRGLPPGRGEVEHPFPAWARVSGRLRHAGGVLHVKLPSR